MSINRDIIKINENACTGCGLCVPNCPEGALQIIDGKARLVSELFCDGLGACIGHCPENAITVEKREAEPYNEKKVMENIVRQGDNTIKAHLEHLKNHGAVNLYNEAIEYLKEKNIPIPVHQPSGLTVHSCPGSAVLDFANTFSQNEEAVKPLKKQQSQLRQWPVQLMLVPTTAPYFNDAELVITADCVPFSYAGFHDDFLKGKIVLIGCPKLDNAEFYKNKLTEIFRVNNIRSVTCIYMEVPCCHGLVRIVQSAFKESGKIIPFVDVEIGIKGEIKNKSDFLK